MPRGIRNHKPLSDNAPVIGADPVAETEDAYLIAITDEELAEVRKYHSDYLKADAERNAKLEEDPKRKVKPVRVYDINAGITAVARRKARAMGYADMTNLRKVDGQWVATGVK